MEMIFSVRLEGERHRTSGDTQIQAPRAYRAFIIFRTIMTTLMTLAGAFILAKPDAGVVVATQQAIPFMNANLLAYIFAGCAVGFSQLMPNLAVYSLFTIPMLSLSLYTFELTLYDFTERRWFLGNSIVYTVVHIGFWALFFYALYANHVILLQARENRNLRNTRIVEAGELEALNDDNTPS